ncbi:hypothetical protein J536_2370 [Acinetobacter sp. 809848]|nr:hypothetical protein J536_2370 [Acinetobacter sp. 809848]
MPSKLRSRFFKLLFLICFFENANLGEKINGMTRKDWDQHRVLINYRYTF